MSEERSNAAIGEAELERLDDQALARLVKERANQPTIQVSVEDLSGPDDASEGIGFKAEEMRGEYRASADPVGWVRPEAVTRQGGATTCAGQTHRNDWIKARLREIGTLYCGQSPSALEVNTRGIGTPYVTGPEHWDGHNLILGKWTTNPGQTHQPFRIFD